MYYIKLYKFPIIDVTRIYLKLLRIYISLLMESLNVILHEILLYYWLMGSIKESS